MNPTYQFELTDGYNIANNYGALYGYYMNARGRLEADPNWNTTDFIPVTAGTTYFFGNYDVMVLFDLDQKQQKADFDKSFTLYTIPEGIAYIRLCLKVQNWELLNMETTTIVHPIYKDDLSKDYEQETNQQFFRPKFSGKLTFVRDDYRLIMDKDFDTEYKLIMRQTNDNGATFVNDFVTKFMRTDCVINEDDLTIEVQPDNYDLYNSVLANIEKEFNITKIKAEITPLTVQKRPLIQVYIPGDSVVSCFVGGTYWEQNANATSSTYEIVRTYHFYINNLLKDARLTVVSGSDTGATGRYVGRISFNGDRFQATFNPEGIGGYQLSILQYYDGNGYFGSLHYKVIRRSDGVVRFQADITQGTANDHVVLTPVNGATGSAVMDVSTFYVFMRLLLDVDSVRGVATYPIPANDIVDNNRNYNRCVGLESDSAFISTRLSDTPTEWGIYQPGEYYLPPYSSVDQKYYPVARSTWGISSLWFAYSASYNSLEESARKAYIINDNFKLSSVIDQLLKEIAPGVHHDATIAYSEFLYGDTNPLINNKFTVFITPKSNILSLYDEPAQKGNITLQQITNMLRDVFHAYWFIDSYGRFRIEHILWFINGGSYRKNDIIEIDLTDVKNLPNNLPWGYHTSAYQFDKMDMPETFKMKWMDDVSPSFEGQPINVISKFVTRGKIEEINVSNFTTDIDYMLLNPNEISKDGFALFAATGEEFEEYLIKDRYIDANGNFANMQGCVRAEIIIRNPSRVGTIFASGTAGNGLAVVVYCDISGKVLKREGLPPSTGTQVYTNLKLSPPANTYIIYIQSTNQQTYNYISTYVLPFVRAEVDNEILSLQNGYLSFVTLPSEFWLYDMPAYRLEINGEEIYARRITKKKKQEVSYPTLNDPNLMSLVKTKLGLGNFDKISINLSSRMNKATLKYDTKDDAK